MIATPTGSTAYNMSAGGPLVHTEVSALLLTPICPLSLSFRPVILPWDTKILIKCSKNARSSAFVSIDGHSRFEMEKGIGLEILKSQYPMIIFSRNSDKIFDWVERVKIKLNWNYRAENKKQKVSIDLSKSINSAHKDKYDSEKTLKNEKWQMTPSYKACLLELNN